MPRYYYKDLAAKPGMKTKSRKVVEQGGRDGGFFRLPPTPVLFANATLISSYSKLTEIAVVPLKKIKRLERNRESARFLLELVLYGWKGGAWPYSPFFTNRESRRRKKDHVSSLEVQSTLLQNSSCRTARPRIFRKNEF